MILHVFKRMASVGGLCERDLLPPQSETSGLGMFFLRARKCGEVSSASSMADDREPEGACKPRFDRDRFEESALYRMGCDNTFQALVNISVNFS